MVSWRGRCLNSKWELEKRGRWNNEERGAMDRGVTGVRPGTMVGRGRRELNQGLNKKPMKKVVQIRITKRNSCLFL